MKRARFVDETGQEIAPSQENSVERSLDLTYEAGLPTAPAQIQANGKTYTFQSADKEELTSHKLHISNSEKLFEIKKNADKSTFSNCIFFMKILTFVCLATKRLPINLNYF